MSKEDLKDRTVIATQKNDPEEQKSSYEPFLIQISGRETGRMFNLKGKNFQIGRDRTCAIAVEDQHVSRAHAEIVWSGQQIILRDLGSTNGVFANGAKVTEHVLMENDKIRIGTRLFFRFCYQDAMDQNFQQTLFKAANMDSLTQLYNKKYFVDALSKEFSYARRAGSPLSLMMMDIDHFKPINDSHGHRAGDAVLKHLGGLLTSGIRHENVACRYGGEEFALILRNATISTAQQVAERLRMKIENEVIIHEALSLKITVSIGVASVGDPTIVTIEDLVEAADQALYDAKAHGRNRTVLKKAA